MTGEITLKDALAQIESSAVRERADGLANLRHILVHNKHNARFENLKDDSFLWIYQALFKVAVLEKSTWLKASTSITLSAAENRFSSCAQALRHAVDVGTRVIKLRTVRALLDHITETLPLSDGRLCRPIALDYAKSLVALFSFKPHVEHLGHKEWERNVLFCLDMVKCARSQADNVDAANTDSTSRSRASHMHGLSYRSSRSHIRESGGSQEDQSIFEQVTEALIVAMNLLVSAQNSPVRDQAPTILWSLIEFLKTDPPSNKSQHAAFTTINQVLACIYTEHVSLTAKATAPLLRLVTYFWAKEPKAQKLKDEMLITLLRLRPYIDHALTRNKASIIRSEIRPLYDVLRLGYIKQQGRDQLHLENLRLAVSGNGERHSHIIGTAIFQLRCVGPRAEHNWTLLHLLASLHVFATEETLTAEEIVEDFADGSHEDAKDRPSKKPRLTSAHEDIITDLTTGVLSTKLVALQTLVFLLQQKLIPISQLARIVDHLSPLCNEDNGVVAPWAFLALASCASQLGTDHPSMTELWAAVWQLACRFVSTALTCRTSAYLLYLMIKLDLVPQASVVKLVQNFSGAMDLNGPCLLADSVLHLLKQLVSFSNGHNPTLSTAAAETSLNWLFRTFLPSNFEEKAYAAAQSLYEVGDLTQLIESCLNHPFQTAYALHLPIWNTMAQTWAVCEREHEVVAYLLLLSRTAVTRDELSQSLEDVTVPAGSMPQARVSSELLLLNFFISEIQRTEDRFHRCVRERPTSINTDMFRCVCVSGVVVTHLAFCHDYRDARQQIRFRDEVQALLTVIGTFSKHPSCDQNKVDLMLSAFAQIMRGPFDGLNTGDITVRESEKVLCAVIDNFVRARRDHQDYNGPRDDEDLMDVEDSRDSQESRTDQLSITTLEQRSKIAALNSPLALRSNVILYAAIVIQQERKGATEVVQTNDSTEIVDFLLDLPGPTILFCHDTICALNRLDLSFDSADAERLLVHFADTFLSSYSYERSEVATDAVLNVMSTIVTFLPNRANLRLFDLGVEVYSWYTSTALDAGVLSPLVQTKLAELLLQICTVDSEYPGKSDVPSVRTNLFKIVQRGSIATQFRLAGRISTIFGSFVLSAHAAMFDDLVTNLPTDADWLEGLAIRLLFFSKLASVWQSLLRECVYYIFETAGRVKASTQYAAHCLTQLVATLKSTSTRDLFRLFAPQLLHTWLEQHSLTALPYAAFGYITLNDLLRNNQAEITSQIMMRQMDGGLQFIATELKTSAKQICEKAFSRCAAYAISWDVASSSNSTASETHLRRTIGSKEEYKTLLAHQFPTVIGHFFLCTKQEDADDKWLHKMSTYQTAAKAREQIKDFSQSDRSLPNSQEPAFKSRYLVDQLDRLSRRVGLDMTQLWNSSTLSLVIRMLLDQLSDVLGSLHNCLVLRKLRLLVTMTGEAALQGHPLEILLYNIRPFLSDSQCADDAIGVLQYLLDGGKKFFIQHNPSFVHGQVLIMVLQMRQYSASLQDSTTQENQHQATVHKMEDFCKWLINYLRQNYRSRSQPGKDDPLYESVDGISLPGDTRAGSPRSRLLQFLLDEQVETSPTISKNDGLAALRLLTKNFQTPPSTADEFLCDDEAAILYAAQLAEVLRSEDLDTSFMLWASGVLGRAYAVNGKRRHFQEHQSILQHQRRWKGLEHSYAMIAARLTKLIFSDNRHEAGLAELAVRASLSTFTEPETAVAFESTLSPSLLQAAADGTYGYEPSVSVICKPHSSSHQSIEKALMISEPTTDESWAKNVATALCSYGKNVPVLPVLIHALQEVVGLALDLLPPISHVLLMNEIAGEPVLRDIMSKYIPTLLTGSSQAPRRVQECLLQLLLYLRRQPYPGEATNNDRLRWLEIDPILISKAALHCNMPTTALMVAEAGTTRPTNNYRLSTRTSLSQTASFEIPTDLLLAIFKQLEEPDSFYGVDRSASLDIVLDRLDYEQDGFKGLIFRSARLESEMRAGRTIQSADSLGLIRSLSALNLNYLTYTLLSQSNATTEGTSAHLIDAAWQLQQWDLATPDMPGHARTCFTVLQDLTRARDRTAVLQSLQSARLHHLQALQLSALRATPLHAEYSTLAFLTETADIISASDDRHLRSIWEKMRSRQSWMRLANHEEYSTILSGRPIVFNVLAQNQPLLDSLKFNARTCKILELKSLIELSGISREHNLLQEALSASTRCSSVVNDYKRLGLYVDGAVELETAKVLWAAGEASASVKMLRDLAFNDKLEEQTIPIGRAGLLAQLAHELAQARLESPEEISTRYLRPAIDYLTSRTIGEEAGDVFFEFASFCDQQLQSPINTEELARMTKLRNRKAEEMDALRALARERRSGRSKDSLEADLGRAKKWYDLDNAEYERLKSTRDAFVQQSLQNYLLALCASSAHDICVLRVFALWLDSSESSEANAVITTHLSRVPSWKFVVLLNQLMSRLENSSNHFQKLLTSLAQRMCAEHPYHSLGHLYATSRKPHNDDALAKSRYEAAANIRNALKGDTRVADIQERMFKAYNLYDKLAKADLPSSSSSRVSLQEYKQAYQIVGNIHPLRLPPVTFTPALRPDGRYDDVPYTTRFSHSVMIMGGMSKPKVLTLTASDGKEYKQLFKSGSDDLRQDAIMEQVFDEVSKLLQKHRATRQRSLHINTYKVVPLTAGGPGAVGAGVLEFVPNTVPIDKFLRKAHEEYHPQDMKVETARQKIKDAEKLSTETRVKEYQKICSRIHPIMRHFFFERYDDPNVWFERRTAYTRTTASISMLGHVLGLGDRHCQNILLDEKTGEVVHIDLGVAFEAGRVLPVPELVPFRLTRDIVDAMGVTQTEGVFRRCCEFTMDALREDKETIMTLLNVLRYDPLYSWTLSPVRAKRVQDQETGMNVGETDEGGGSKKKEREAAEADRALSIVEKKLSKTLSTAATVNELIQQASDERNLARLFCGWSAFF